MFDVYLHSACVWGLSSFNVEGLRELLGKSGGGDLEVDILFWLGYLLHCFFRSSRVWSGLVCETCIILVLQSRGTVERARSYVCLLSVCS